MNQLIYYIIVELILIKDKIFKIIELIIIFEK